MVFLQLEVKVYPREPVPGPQNKDNGDQNGPKTYVGLWLSIENPEECTIAHLVWLINKEWAFMFPEEEKLEIKKLINDERPMVLLHPKMSVAHYWVNKGKASADGCDQYGAVGVIQKPSTAPQRFLSVPPGFEHEVQAENARLSSRVSPIAEEPELAPGIAMSVESEPVIAKPSKIVVLRCKRRASRSPDHPSVKAPRLGTDQARSQPSRPSVQAKAQTPELPDGDWSLCPDGHRMPTFASPRQNTRYSKPNPKGLGLDVKSSPKAWKTTRASDVSSPLPPFPSSALSSAKNSNPHRRVSFTDSAVPQSATRISLTPSQVSVTPSSQATVVYPPGITKEKIAQIEKATRERAALLEEARAMAKDSHTDPSIIETVRNIGSLDDKIHELKNLPPKERKARSRHTSRQKEELDALLGKFKKYKADLKKEQKKEQEKDKENEDMMDIDPKEQAESESESESESSSESGSESGSGSESPSQSGSESESGSGPGSESESDGSEPSDGEDLAQAADEEMEDEPREPTRETVGSTAVSDAKDGETLDEDSDEEEDPTPRKKHSKNVMSLFDIEADDSPADDEQEDSDEEYSEEEEDSEDSDEVKTKEKVEESDSGDESNSVSSSKSEKISNITDEAQDQVNGQATPSKNPEEQTVSNPTLSQRAAYLQADLEAPFSPPSSAAHNANEDDSSSSSESSSDSELDPALGYGIPQRPTTSVFDPPAKNEMDRPMTLLERVALARRDEAARVAREQEAREQEARELASSQPKPDASEPSVSEAESVDDMGDMLPNGTWGKIRRPRFNR